MTENPEFPIYVPFRTVNDSDYLFETPPETPTEVTALNTPQPLKMLSLLSKRPWGGNKLRQILGKSIPEKERIGESWEISGYEGAESVVKDGDLKGFNINDLMKIWNAHLLGEKVNPSPDNSFPLLAKFIDSSENLSVQVHPGDILNEHGDVVAWGKTEAWYVLYADADSFVYQGFNQDVTAEIVKKHIENGTIEQILRKIPVKAGDVIVNPATVVHSIGAGVLLYEIQQVSDATYRLYDFGRQDRKLHIEDALRVAYLKQGLPEEQSPKTHVTAAITELAKTSYFKLFELTIQRDKIVKLDDLPKNVCYLLSCVHGNVEINSGDFTTQLQIGESVLIPAKLIPLNSINGSGKVILSTPA